MSDFTAVNAAAMQEGISDLNQITENYDSNERRIQSSWQ